ncbi:MAG: hypothetical protein ABI841_06600 [Chloroflexota bacterium]
MTDEPPPEEKEASDREVHLIDVLVDELALARAQIDAGLPGLAEGTLRRRLAWLEASGIGGGDETDAARTLLAEALWRQQRLLAARAALDGVRPGSPQRRLPIATIIEAEVLAAAGELDRAAGAVERVVDNVGVDQAFALRAGAHGRATWPLPAELLPEPPRRARPPWSADRPQEDVPDEPPDDARKAAARGRMEEARVAYVSGAVDRGDVEMSIAVRLDPSLAGDGVAILEPTLGGQPSSDRLLLYGDLLRAAGREVEANRAYDRAADRQA